MSKHSHTPHYVAFQQGKRVAEGSEADIAAVVPRQGYGEPTTLVFDLNTGEQIELPPTPSPTASATDQPGRPGRPKLGVVAREVTLLPHDWEWLNQQPGGASVTLRKLVLKARRASVGADRVRQAQVVCYRFINAIAGHEIGFEEATRALFTGQPERFDANTASWPPDVRDHARRLAAMAFEAVDTAPHPTGESA